MPAIALRRRWRRSHRKRAYVSELIKSIRIVGFGREEQKLRIGNRGVGDIEISNRMRSTEQKAKPSVLLILHPFTLSPSPSSTGLLPRPLTHTAIQESTEIWDVGMAIQISENRPIAEIDPRIIDYCENKAPKHPYKLRCLWLKFCVCGNPYELRPYWLQSLARTLPCRQWHCDQQG